MILESCISIFAMNLGDRNLQVSDFLSARIAENIPALTPLPALLQDSLSPTRLSRRVRKGES